MGYMNELCFAVKNSVKVPQKVLKHFEEYCEPTKNKNFTYYFLGDVKWGDCYKAKSRTDKIFDRDSSGFDYITDIDDFFQPLYDKGLAAGIRIGEDWDDVEEYGDPSAFDMVCRKVLKCESVFGCAEKHRLIIAISDDTELSKELKFFLKGADRTNFTQQIEFVGVSYYLFEDFVINKWVDIKDEIDDICTRGFGAYIRKYVDDTIDSNGEIYDFDLDFYRYVDILENDVVDNLLENSAAFLYLKDYHKSEKIRFIVHGIANNSSLENNSEEFKRTCTLLESHLNSFSEKQINELYETICKSHPGLIKFSDGEDSAKFILAPYVTQLREPVVHEGNCSTKMITSKYATCISDLLLYNGNFIDDMLLIC